MKFSTDTAIPNLGKVVSRDDSRPVLTMAHLDVERGVLEATDSYKAVAVPVDVEEGDVSGYIPPECLQAFYKAHKKRRAVAPSLVCRPDTLELVDDYNATRQSWTRPNPGQWPNLPNLTPGPEDWSGFRIRLNAKFLLELAAGLGGEEVTLTFIRSRNKLEEGEGVGFFPDNLRPMIVHNGSSEHGAGLLMPIRISD